MVVAGAGGAAQMDGKRDNNKSTLVKHSIYFEKEVSEKTFNYFEI